MKDTVWIILFVNYDFVFLEWEILCAICGYRVPKCLVIGTPYYISSTAKNNHTP